MKTFKDLIDERINKIEEKEKLKKLYELLEDFGFQSEYEYGYATFTLPENPFGIECTITFDMDECCASDAAIEIETEDGFFKSLSFVSNTAEEIFNSIYEIIKGWINEATFKNTQGGQND